MFMKAKTLLALAAGVVLVAPSVEARITKIEITSVESPTFEGRTFGSVGAYEKLRGKAYGEVDPRDRRNRVSTDVERAPRNAPGHCEHSLDSHVRKPAHPRAPTRHPR